MSPNHQQDTRFAALVAFASVAFFACGGTTTEPSFSRLQAGSLAASSGPLSCSAQSALICHFPPGNRANARSLCVGWAAVPAHVRNHGDTLGACGGMDGGAADAGGASFCGFVADAGTGGAGSACSADPTCFSNLCVGGLCQAGQAATPCGNGADCISGQCDLSNCACLAGGPEGAGSSCVVGNQCLSGSCTSGVCDPSGPGGACRLQTDCQPTLSCVAGVCQ